MLNKTLQPDRQVHSPEHLSKSDAWAIVKRVFFRLESDNITMLAAATAFYALLALFPALAAVVALYALVANPQDILQHLSAIEGVVPADVLEIVNGQLTAITGEENELGLRFIVGLAIALWSAHRGIHALVNTITIAYRERETRNFIYLNLLTLVLTLGAIIMAVVVMIVMLITPVMLSFFPISAWESTLTTLATWVILFVVVILALSVLYRFSPPRKPAKWRWLSPGATLATVLWVSSSYGFSIYVNTFGNYSETYGALGAIIVLLLWFFITSFVVVLGALLNAEMEFQTLHDTTIGEAKPIGERGAVVADTHPPEM